MLTVDPHARITCDEILKHPWMLEYADVKLEISDNLKKYNARRRLKKTSNVIKAVGAFSSSKK